MKCMPAAQPRNTHRRRHVVEADCTFAVLLPELTHMVCCQRIVPHCRLRHAVPDCCEADELLWCNVLLSMCGREQSMHIFDLVYILFMITMTSTDVMHVSDELRHDLMRSHIEPFYRSVVERSISAKFFWRTTAIVPEATSKVLIAAAGVVSFSTGYFVNSKDALSFTSGTLSCLSLACIQCASFAHGEHSKQLNELNRILRELRINTIPPAIRVPVRTATSHRDDVHY